MRYQLLPALTLLAIACGPPRPWSPLAEAAGRNDTAAMKALLDAGLPGTADRPHELLMWAARNGAADAIALLAARGADVNEPDAGRNHWTPLQHAAHRQQPAAVRALLEWGAEPDATQPGNTTPLFMAADSADPTMARLLLEAGADPGWTGPGGRTPLTQAVSGGALWDVTDRPLLGGCRTATVQAFMTMYPRLRVPDNRTGKTAVMWARAHDCAQVLKLIDVNPNTRGQSARSAVGLIHEVLGVPTPQDVF